MKNIIAKVAERRDLTAEEAEQAALDIMEGRAGEAEMASFLTAMRMKGETPEEIAAIARVMRQKCRRVSSPEDAMDLCGTGGAKVKTYNVSTVSSIVVASTGVPVAKHGNRSFTSRSGSADLLESLGVNISIEPEMASRMLHEGGITFLFAPLYHPATRNVSPVRKALPFRTVFNILGPITNPANVHRQLVGVFSEDYVDKVAQALSILGTEKAMVVHGRIGIDELSPSGETEVTEVKNGVTESYTITASEFSGFGLEEWSVPQTASPGESALFANRVLAGKSGFGERSIVLLNAGAALYVAGRVRSVEDGMGKALESIEKGRALEKMNEFVLLSSGGRDNG